jgi:hypothetical protein
MLHQANKNGFLVGGIPTPLKNMKVSWDYDIPNIWTNKIHVANNQPALYFIWLCIMI